MGLTNIYADRRLVSVTCIGGSVNYQFGFRTPIDETEGAALGHTAITSTFPSLFILGAKLPRPPKLKKKTVSSYCSEAQLTAALAAGWKRLKRRKQQGSISQTVALGKTTGSFFVTVPVRGVSFAWRMPVQVYNKIGNELAGLGVEAPTTEADFKRAVVGANFPRPPRAGKTVSTTAGDELSFSTFYDPTVTLPAGWTHIKDGVVD